MDHDESAEDLSEDLSEDELMDDDGRFDAWA